MTSVGIMASGVGSLRAPSLLVDPCDNYTFAPWVTTSGTPAISASGHTGNAFSFPVNTGIAYDLAAGGQTSILTFGAWMRWSVLPASVSPYVRWRSDAGATIHNELHFDNANTVGMRLGSAGAFIGGVASSGIVVNTWYFIEASVTLGDGTAGSVTVRRDGITILNVAGVDTRNGGTKAVYDRLQIVNNNGTMLVDDVYIRNDASFGP